MAGDVAELPTWASTSFRVAGEDWGAAIATPSPPSAARVRQLVFQETLLPSRLPAGRLPGGEHDPPLGADDVRTGWHFHLLQPAESARAAAAGREQPHSGPTTPGARGEFARSTRRTSTTSCTQRRQPGGTRAILEMYRARQTDAEQNRPALRRPDQLPGPGRRRAGLSRGRSLQTARASGPRRPLASSSSDPATTSRWRTRARWLGPTSSSSLAG